MPKIPISASPHVFYIRPAPGWLDVVLNEVTGIIKSPLHKYKFDPKITLLKSTVKVHRCDWRQGLEIMLRLTTAHDVEWMILESKCSNWWEVEAILKRVPWEDVLPSRDVLVHVTPSVSNGFTNNTAKLRESLCAVARVKHVSEGESLRFKIDLREDFLRISASLCGEPLYKRGYKAKLTAVAPLPEHHAAACARWVLELANEPPNTVFIPFAGTGTMGFETMLVLSGAGPGAFLRQFACDLFPATPEATMSFFRRKLSEKLAVSPLPQIFFNDFNRDALELLKENTAGFPRHENVTIVEGDAFEVNISFLQGNVLILLNPPYGDRLAKKISSTPFYGRLGKWIDTLHQTHRDTICGGCICPDEESWRSFNKNLGKISVETHHFTHGGNEMRFVRWKT